MHRCFVEPTQWDEREMILSPDEEHHVIDVLRAVAGDRVAVFDGKGKEALAELVASSSKSGSGRRRMLLRVIRTGVRPTPDISLTLFQALPKGQKMDFIVEKATELGATEIIPVVTERTIVRLDKVREEERIRRWQRIALSAARQCGTSWAPDVRHAIDFRAAADGFGSYELCIIGSLLPDAQPLRSVIERARKTNPRRLALLIGPEGDFTPSETGIAAAKGAIAANFGSLVFRVETAALFGLSVLAYEFLPQSRRAAPISSAGADLEAP